MRWHGHAVVEINFVVDDKNTIFSAASVTGVPTLLFPLCERRIGDIHVKIAFPCFYFMLNIAFAKPNHGLVVVGLVVFRRRTKKPHHYCVRLYVRNQLIT